jgi:hypothetical protein
MENVVEVPETTFWEARTPIVTASFPKYICRIHAPIPL